MSSGFYDKAKQSFTGKQIDWINDTFKVVLCDTTVYTVNKTTDQFRSDIPSGAQKGTSAALTTKANPAGVLDADDVVVSAVTGTNLVAVVFQDTGLNTTDRLVMYIDTGSGFPISSNGADVNIAWDNGANKIGKI